MNAEQPARRSWAEIDLGALRHNVAAARARVGGKAKIIDGRHELAPGMIIHPAFRGHTYGSQLLQVNTPRGQLVFGSDTYSSWTGIRVPSGLTARTGALTSRTPRSFPAGEVYVPSNCHDMKHDDRWTSVVAQDGATPPRERWSRRRRGPAGTGGTLRRRSCAGEMRFQV